MEVCTKIDETLARDASPQDLEGVTSGIIEPTNLPVQLKTVEYENGFYNPHLISPRTQIISTGFKAATIKDIIEDSNRCFVLYSDWLQPLAEFQELPRTDQVIN